MQAHHDKRQFLRQIVLPVVAAVALTAAILVLLLVVSTREVDRSATLRQSELLGVVLRDSVRTIAHDQEASTVWDDAVVQMRRRPLDLDWLDANLGVWFGAYYGHDAVFIVDPGDRPVYAMRGGHRADPADFAAVAAAARPLMSRVRAALRAPRPLPADVRSPGAADLVMIGARPAILSVKPIVPDTAKVSQRVDRACLHLSIRFLDASFVRGLQDRYWFDGARFATIADRRADAAAVPLRSRAGVTLGYVEWRPFRPGARVLHRLGPVLAAELLVVALIVAALLMRIRRSARALQMSRARAQHLAFHDPLTGLPNRALFEDRLQQEIARVRRGQGAFALLYLDLDRFKRVNDTLGHPAGDALIRELGRRLGAIVRQSDTVARLGGDEFAIIQSGAATAAEAEILALRIVEAVAHPFDVLGGQVHVGISIGVALSPADGLDRVELCRRADIALYQSKTHGRGRFTHFADEMDSTIRVRQTIERDLRAALECGDQFAVCYQPQYSAATGQMTGVEALVRWRHPERGPMSPATFIPVAEESGLIEPLGEWVLREACRTARDWPLGKLSVNVSAMQLRRAGFAARVLDILEATGFAPHRLELEIGETQFIENAAECRPNIARLRARGVQIALDDFGIGYSPIGYLRQIDVDRVKIDPSFVNAIAPGNGDSAIIRAIVDLAQATGLGVTAEGVETADQSRFLAAVGCDALQGFLLSRPLGADAIGRLLAEQALAARG